MSKREARLEEIFKDACRTHGAMVVKLAPTMRGVPDRLVLAPGGRMFLVELKADGGSPSPIQLAWHQRAHRLGVRVHVLRGEREIHRWVSTVVAPRKEPS